MPSLAPLADDGAPSCATDAAAVLANGTKSTSEPESTPPPHMISSKAEIPVESSGAGELNGAARVPAGAALPAAAPRRLKTDMHTATLSHVEKAAG